MDRYTALERLAARARREAAVAAREQFAPFREFAAGLAAAAITSTDEEFFKLLLSRDLERKPGQLLRQADPGPLAAALERAMGAALVSGATARKPPPPRLRRRRTVRAGKPCGDSHIPEWKECAKGLSAGGKALVERYKKGVAIQSPTGRTVEFGKRIADHIAGHSDANRHRFADLAETCAASPDEIWQDGLRFRYIKNPARAGGKSAMVVISRQTGDNSEEVITFTKKKPRELKNIRRGRKIYPAE